MSSTKSAVATTYRVVALGVVGEYGQQFNCIYIFCYDFFLTNPH